MTLIKYERPIRELIAASQADDQGYLQIDAIFEGPGNDHGAVAVVNLNDHSVYYVNQEFRGHQDLEDLISKVKTENPMQSNLVKYSLTHSWTGYAEEYVFYSTLRYEQLPDVNVIARVMGIEFEPYTGEELTLNAPEHMQDELLDLKNIISEFKENEVLPDEPFLVVEEDENEPGKWMVIDSQEWLIKTGFETANAAQAYADQQMKILGLNIPPELMTDERVQTAIGTMKANNPLEKIYVVAGEDPEGYGGPDIRFLKTKAGQELPNASMLSRMLGKSTNGQFEVVEIGSPGVKVEDLSDLVRKFKDAVGPDYTLFVEKDEAPFLEEPWMIVDSEGFQLPGTFATKGEAQETVKAIKESLGFDSDLVESPENNEPGMRM